MQAQLILVVDDDVPVLRLVARILEKSGYRVLAAEGPEEALRSFGAHTDEISLVICDVIMHGMCGPELVDRLIESKPSLAVLYMSGHTHSNLVRDRIAARGIPMLAKPFTISLLLAQVRAMLDPQGASASA